jgi:hypothetical protein
MAAANAVATTMQNRRIEPLPPMNVYNPYPMGLQQQTVPNTLAQRPMQQTSGFELE